MHCNRCGHDNGEDARFCSSCGSPLDVPEEVVAGETVAEEAIGAAPVDPEELEGEAAVAAEALAAADAGDAPGEPAAAPDETVVVEADETTVVAEEAAAGEADTVPERQPLPDAPGAPVPPDELHPTAGPAPEARWPRSPDSSHWQTASGPKG